MSLDSDSFNDDLGIANAFNTRALETVQQVRQEPHHFLASGQLQLSPDYKAGSKRSRARGVRHLWKSRTLLH